jgi:Fe-S-cluster containining protein
MIDDEIPEVDPITRIERQLERGSLFTHTALSRNAEVAHEVASIAFGLVDLLVHKGLVSRDEVLESARAVREEMVARGETVGPGVALRVDAPVEPGQETVLVNCQERLLICRAICCKLSFALTAQEVEAGHVKWDLGMPYHIRHEASGFCTHLQDNPRGCGVYEHRPAICRRWSCAGDERIWTDFDAMVLNDQWINAHLGGTTPRLAAAQMVPLESALPPEGQAISVRE